MEDERILYLLIGIHRSEASLMARLAALGGDVLDFFLGAVGEVARVGVICHDGCDMRGNREDFLLFYLWEKRCSFR